MQKKLEAIELRPEIRHANLKEMSNELTSTREELAQLKSDLNIYSDLTPDTSLARAQVQDLKEQLAQMEMQIADNISNINSN